MPSPKDLGEDSSEPVPADVPPTGYVDNTSATASEKSVVKSATVQGVIEADSEATGSPVEYLQDNTFHATPNSDPEQPLTATEPESQPSQKRRLDDVGMSPTSSSSDVGSELTASRGGGSQSAAKRPRRLKDRMKRKDGSLPQRKPDENESLELMLRPRVQKGQKNKNWI